MVQEGCRLTAKGKRIWSRQAVWHILQNPVYQGTAAYGKTLMAPRTKKSRLRPARGRQAEPRRSHSAVSVAQSEWVFMPAPAIVDRALFAAAQDQLIRQKNLWVSSGSGVFQVSDRALVR
ncbi:MAG: recombinase family protein [Bryobacteraceae bacterium]